MTTTLKNIIPRKVCEATPTAQYTAVNCKTIIDKFTVTNTSAFDATFSCHLVANAQSPTDANLVLNEKTVLSGETYLCPELVGQSLEAGGYISTNCNLAGTLTISSTGREFT